MLRTIDRYLIREIAVPFAIALVVLTFVLEIPVILQYGEDLVAKGAEWSIVLQVLLTLLPQALSLTIPMAVLLGILIGFGRLSADREFVALQACGVSLARLLSPVALVAVLSTAATAYQTIVALPDANQTFREIVYGIMASRVESSVRPRVFFDDFPHRVIYVRDLPREGGWRDVFFAVAEAGQVTVYFAREGHIVIDRERRLLQLQLIDGTSHWTSLADPDAYQSSGFETSLINLDPELVFPRPPAKGVREMTFAELRAGIDEAARRGESANDHRFFFQQKLSLPATCPILAFIALALGASSRKDGKLASFVLGLGVIFVYYVLLWAARALALGERLNPDWAPWIPNLIMGSVAIALLAWRAHAADRPIQFTAPAFWRRATEGAAQESATRSRPASRGSRVVVVVRFPRLNVPLPRILDRYVARSYLRVFALSVLALLGVFYISTFIDLADKLFRGEATTALVLRYFFFQTPQFVYFVIPISVLVAVLVTLGILAKNSELVVMRACGISVYRTVVPLVSFALLASGTLFLMQEHLLATSNREADRLNRIIRGWPPASLGARQWVAGTNGDLYRFDYFDAETNKFSRLWAYHVDRDSWGLAGISYAEAVSAVERDGPDGPTFEWRGHQGWFRELTPSGHDRRMLVKYLPFEERSLLLDPPSYFKVDIPDAEMMTYSQLRDYIEQLQSGGVYAARFLVSLQRKVAFPFVTVVMTMLAVPFAVSTRSRGALYGIGIGIVVSILYWIALSLFGALGAGGVLEPMLAAWAPNILFGSVALYMILTVRT